MASFDIYWENLKKYEGGYADASKDKSGGETYRGIARNVHPKWDGWPVVDAKKKSGPIKHGTVFPELEGKVKSFFKKNYWDVRHGDSIKNQSVAESIVDFTVNGGFGKNTISSLQKFVGAEEDGKFGRDTVNSINNYRNQKGVYDFIQDKREEHFKNLAESNPSKYGEQLEGWMARLNKMFFNATETVKKNKTATLFIALIIIVIFYFIYKWNAKK